LRGWLPVSGRLLLSLNGGFLLLSFRGYINGCTLFRRAFHGWRAFPGFSLLHLF
jgi:hypothetical protein